MIDGEPNASLGNKLGYTAADECFCPALRFSLNAHGEGAHFFVNGDARRMAKDVDAALRKIVQEKGGKDMDAANEYVEKLKSDKRYKRDVY